MSTALPRPVTHDCRPIAWALLALASGACGAIEDLEDVKDSQDTETVAPSSETEAIVRPLFRSDQTTLWNDNQPGVGATINVCFTVRPRLSGENADVVKCPLQTSRDRDCLGRIMSTDVVRHLIRRHVEDNWARHANLEFIGWGDCPIDAATNKHVDIKMPGMIAIQFSEPFALSMPNKACTSDSDCLSVEPNGSAECREQADKTMICEENGGDWSGVGKVHHATVVQYNYKPMLVGDNLFNLVHEFGHALGFTHEWLREDWMPANECPDPDEPFPVDGAFLTPFPDRDSIMNYCNRNTPSEPRLSAGDVVGLQRAYGRKYDGSIVGHRGLCADIRGATTADGTPVIGFPCRGQWNDTFFRDTSSTFELLKSRSNSKCLNVSGGTAPAPVISWGCGAFENSRFSTTGVQWRAMGNLCVQASSATSGSKLVVRPCDEALFTQKWDFFHPVGGLRHDQVRLSGTQLCVATTSDAGAIGQELVLSRCSSSSVRQRFVRGGNGLLKYTNARSLCTAIKGGLTPTPGQRVILSNGCSSTPLWNSQFTLGGRIRTLGHCMELEGNFADPGTPIRAGVCQSARDPMQLWEYYF